MDSKASVPRFETDVFISYTHIDNQAFGEDHSQWVSDLHERLKIRLDQLVGDPVTIWRDAKLTGNDTFAEALYEKLEHVGLLVSILSPRYLQSEWCVRELEKFVAAAKRNSGLHVGNKARLFKVVKTPVPLPRQPDEMQRLLGYDFFHELESGKVREFHLDPSPEARRAYWARLDDLAQDIQTLLLELRSGNAGRSVDASESPQATVYLAEATSDLRSARDGLKRDLEARGYRILPDTPLPLDVAGLTAAVRKDLSVARLSIHPIGARYGTVPEGDERSVAHIQLDVALGAAHEGACRSLVWIPEALSPAEGRQEDFIRKLERMPVPGTAFEVMRVPMEVLKTYVLEQLDTSPAATDAQPASDEAVRVYLICDRQDFDAVQPIKAYLEGQGCSVILPLQEGSEIEIREDHQDSLVVCDAVLIYYGAAREFWLRTKLRDLLKAAGWGRTRPFMAKALYLGPPSAPEKQSFQTNEVQFIKGGEIFSPHALQSFVGMLHMGAGKRH